MYTSVSTNKTIISAIVYHLFFWPLLPINYHWLRRSRRPSSLMPRARIPRSRQAFWSSVTESDWIPSRIISCPYIWERKVNCCSIFFTLFYRAPSMYRHFLSFSPFLSLLLSLCLSAFSLPLPYSSFLPLSISLLLIYIDYQIICF